VSLEQLNLADNQLDTVPECLQSHLGALQFLTLDGNKIVKVEDSSFTGLGALHILSISNLRDLREVHSGALKGLAGLKEFRCSNNENLARVDKTLFFMGEEKMQQDWSINSVSLQLNVIFLV